MKVKLILSRKGFDSASGKAPSPIFPDGSMISLPIPDRRSSILYSDINSNGKSIAPLISDLTKGRILPYYGAHLDPDLRHDSLKRHPRWRPIFGQTGKAQSHLQNNNVGIGDLFLFFGLFRHCSLENGKYYWVRVSRPVHVIWGWLQIEEILNLNSNLSSFYDWVAYHPHFRRAKERNNVLYISSEHLSINGIEPGQFRGAGIFPFFSEIQQLTSPSASNAGTWRLPEWFMPRRSRLPLTYHSNLERWSKIDCAVELKSVGRGQEFILDSGQYPEIFAWLSELFEELEN